MTHNDPGWLTIVQDDIPGVRGAPGGPGGPQGAPGGSRLPPTPKRVIKQQNNDPKPWLKVPKVCCDPKGVVFTQNCGIWGHLDALQQQYSENANSSKTRSEENFYTIVSTAKFYYMIRFFGNFPHPLGIWGGVENCKNLKKLHRVGCGSDCINA